MISALTSTGDMRYAWLVATNKNQHYVPRCLLKPFTLDREGRSICVFNIDRQSFIANAPVKSQCSASYFYGKDSELDKIIGMAETEFSFYRDNILGSNDIFSAQECGNRLAFFWLMQHLRTEAASRLIAGFAEEADHVFGGGRGKLTFQPHDAVSMAMRICFESVSDIKDLKTCLIKNRSGLKFITSDDPAVLTNCPMLRRTRGLEDGFGMNSAGAVLILPISPEVLFVAYDPAVYDVPNVDGWVALDNTEDADAFNQHQMLNAFSNVYLCDIEQKEYARHAFDRLRTLRPTSRCQFRYYVLVQSKVGGRRADQYRPVSKAEIGEDEETLMAFSPVRAVPASWPSQLTLRRDAHGFSNGSAGGIVRKEHIPAKTASPFWKVRLP